MSEVFICTSQIASMPYYLENSGLNVYSIEELGYFLKENIELIDENFMHEELIDWIDEELHHRVLVQKLTAANGDGNINDFIEAILIACNILNKEEIYDVMSIFRQYKNRSAIERRKLKADSLVRRHLYLSAIREYEKLLNMDEIREYKKTFIGDIYHNLGCAYAGMFKFELAKESFSKAFMYNQNEKSRIAMLRSEQYLNNEKVEDVSALMSLERAEESAEEIMGRFSSMGEILEYLKEDYRKLLG